MNFLSIAANKLGNRLEDRMSSPDTAFGRMAQAFGASHPSVDTPMGLQNPDQFAKGVNKISEMPGIDPVNASAQQENMARQNGFRNYAEMMAWAKQRTSQTGGTVPQGGAQPGSVQAGMNGAAMMHPKNMFNYILDRWKAATGGE